MKREELSGELLALRDEKYGAFQRKLIPNIDSERICGVRTPALRELARRVAREDWAEAFLAELPHESFEENQLHAFVIAGMKDYPRCLQAVEAFLPFIDNWATCDQLSPKVFGKHRQELIGSIKSWLASDQVYTVRFGIGMLMQHYLDEAFSPDYLVWVSQIHSPEYYIQMMAAWYFATALAKQEEATLPWFEEGRLTEEVRKKAIRKALESNRISPERKAQLRALSSAGKDAKP